MSGIFLEDLIDTKKRKDHFMKQINVSCDDKSERNKDNMDEQYIGQGYIFYKWN